MVLIWRVDVHATNIFCVSGIIWLAILQTFNSAMVGDLTILGDHFCEYPFKTASNNDGHSANIHKIVENGAFL